MQNWYHDIKPNASWYMSFANHGNSACKLGDKAEFTRDLKDFSSLSLCFLYPTPVFLPRESRGQRSQKVAESQTWLKWQSVHTSAHTCAHMHMHTCGHTCMHTCTHMHVHAHTHTFGMSSSQTPFSKSGIFSVSYRTSSFSHLKTVSFLVFATYKTGVLCWVCELLELMRKKSSLISNHRPKKSK